MAESDRDRWDRRYTQSGGIERAVPGWLAEFEGLIPGQGRALDIASGSGRLALWLARQGLNVLAVDISAVGLELAGQAAQEQGLCLETLLADLETDPLPDAQFEVITCFNYRQRNLFPAIKEHLKPGGLFIAEIATVDNLERHAHPFLRYLAQPGELRQDCVPLEMVYYSEGWYDDRATARAVARSSSVIT